MALTAEQKAEARRLWDDVSLSAAEVGRRVGASKDAITNVARRNDWPERASPIHAADPTSKRQQALLRRQPLPAGASTLPPLASLA